MDLWTTTVWPWVSGWLQTPGFGGAAAVAAAMIAFAGVYRQSRLNAWWQRAEWALDVLVRSNLDARDREMALEMIRVLQSSRLAKHEEQRFLAGVVTSSSLARIGEGTHHVDDAPTLTVPSTRRPSQIRPARRILGVFGRRASKGGPHAGNGPARPQ
ncbi:hypothetical protein [Microbacterium sp.]|uniref:hypothetical protein n=1 Tax=Microbacterium sp. TaxID=51671 RepID=UPI003A853680